MVEIIDELMPRYNYYYRKFITPDNYFSKTWKKTRSCLNELTRATKLSEDVHNKLASIDLDTNDFSCDGSIFNFATSRDPSNMAAILAIDPCKRTKPETMAKSLYNYFYSIIINESPEKINLIYNSFKSVINTIVYFLDCRTGVYDFEEIHSIVLLPVLANNDYESMKNHLELLSIERKFLFPDFNGEEYNPVNAEWYAEGLSKLKEHSAPRQIILNDWAADAWAHKAGFKVILG